MGRNRKFVFEDDLQQAVWRTILRGPRPPSAKCDRTRSTASAASKPSEPSGRSKSAAQLSVKDQMQPKRRGSPLPPRTSMPLEEALAAARARAAKLQLMLDTLGEEDEKYPTIKVLEGARAAARAPHPSNQEASFLVRNQKRVRADTCRHREGPRSLKLWPCRSEQEAVLADGERRLEEAEQAMPSSFSVHVPPVGPDVQAESSRMQETIDKLQRELAKLRSGPAQPLPPAVSDDDGDECRRKKPRAGRTTPLAITGRGCQ